MIDETQFRAEKLDRKVLTEGRRHADNQSLARDFFGQVDLGARGGLVEHPEVRQAVADFDIRPSGRMKGRTWLERCER